MSNAAASILDAPSEALPRTDRKMAVVKSGNTKAAVAATAAGIIKEWGLVHNLTATHCTCCGAGLLDAVSVNRGMGPVCSKKHYELDFPITEAMVEEALGFLHASGLDSAVKRAAKTLKTMPRALCNVLIWWASAHLDETKVVLDCAAVMTALGFVSLGDRVRERNTDVVIVKDGADHFIVRCRSTLTTRRNMRRVKEATTVPREGRFKYGWRVPLTRQDLVWTLLGEDFGGQWATVPDGAASKVETIPKATWMQVRAAFRLAYPPVQVKPRIVRPGLLRGWLDVHTPCRNFGFVTDFKATVPYRDRTWDRRRQCWTVRDIYDAQVRQMVSNHFNGAL